MGIFTFRQAKKISELEEALNSLVVPEGMTFSYVGKDKATSVKSSAYVIPVEVFNNKIYGLFTIDGKLAEAHFGFMYVPFFGDTHYFEINGDTHGVLEEIKKPARNTLYLPLRETELFQGIGTTDEKTGVRTPDKDSPFKILGVYGREKKLPIFMVRENETVWRPKGIYVAQGKPVIYNYCGFEHAEQFFVFIKKMHQSANSSEKEGAKKSGNNSVVSKNASSPEVAVKTKDLAELVWEDPQSVVRYLDNFVIGQTSAKRAVAVAFSNYMTKVRTKDESIERDNVLLIGPSGVGKTYMIQLLARKAELPFVQAKLTGKSSEGYKGQNLSETFEAFRAKTKGEEAQWGVIFLDEIDKLAQDENNGQHFFGQRLQDELIGYFEEETVFSNDKTNAKGLNTKNILFVTAGAFQARHGSLDDIIRQRLSLDRQKMGFVTAGADELAEEKSVLHKVRPEDIIVYGLKPELVGRLPAVAVLSPLSVEDKICILSEARESPLTKYVTLLKAKGYELIIDDALMRYFAEKCPPETGARALKAVCHDIFAQILFDPKKYARDKKIELSPALAKEVATVYA